MVEWNGATTMDYSKLSPYNSRVAMDNAYLSRVNSALKRSELNNPEDLSLYSPAPTITSGTTNLDGTLTKMYRIDTNPEVFRVCGGSPFNWNASGYFRASVVTLPTGTGNADTNKNANAWFIEFATNASKVLVHMLGQTSSGVSIEVDGKKASAAVTPYPATTGNAYFLIDFGSSATRTIRIWLDKAGGFMRTYVGANDTVWKPQGRPVKFAILGDSIAASTGATTRPDGGFATLLGKLLGWEDIRQVALGGTGFVTPDATYNSIFGDSTRIADLTAANPDVILVSTTPNDNGKTTASITESALSAFKAYRVACPNALILVAGIFGGADSSSASKLSNENAVYSAFLSWADGNSRWIPTQTDTNGAWLFGTGKVGTIAGGNSDVYTSADSVHPSPEGHIYWARQFARTIRAIL